MSEAARRAYEAARCAFEAAPEVEAHAWRGTLEKRAAAQAAREPVSSQAGRLARLAEAGRAETGRDRGNAVPSRAQCPVRAENEDDDGYDPWSDRRPSESFWEEDPWR